MQRGKGLWLIACVASAPVLSCAPGDEQPNGVLSRIDLTGTEWVLTSLNGRPVLEGTRISLEVQADGVGGYSGCNWYGARAQRTDSTLNVALVESTARACMVPAGTMEQETEYHAALTGAHAYGERDGRLELYDASGRATLVFDRRVPLAMDPLELVGTRWRLRTQGMSPEPADTSVTLAFEEAGATGFGGCRDYDADYRAQGDRVAFTRIEMASTECPLGVAATQREGQFTTDLSESTYYRMEADRLELIGVTGRTLSFGRDAPR
jgi:heat shock protein HslJ